MKFIGTINGYINEENIKKPFQFEVSETYSSSSCLYIDREPVEIKSAYARFHYIEPPRLSIMPIDGDEITCVVENVNLSFSGIDLEIGDRNISRNLTFLGNPLISVERVDVFVDSNGNNYAALKVLLKADEDGD